MKIVYILINQSMPDLIKVGITEDLERRMKELDKTGIPLPFECFYAVEIDESLAPKIDFIFLLFLQMRLQQMIKNPF